MKLRKMLREAVNLLELLDASDILRHSDRDDEHRPAELIEAIDAYRVKRGWLPPRPALPSQVIAPGAGTVSMFAVFDEWMRDAAPHLDTTNMRRAVELFEQP